MNRIKDIEELARIVVNEAYQLHLTLGPGLLESVYQEVMICVLQEKGFKAEKEVPVSFEYNGRMFNSHLRMDLFVNDTLVVELKSTADPHPSHFKQTDTYVRLLNKKFGLLINFGDPYFKRACQRVINNRYREERP